MTDAKSYFKVRDYFVNNLETVRKVEKEHCLKIKGIVLDIADDLYLDFTEYAWKLYPFWSNYPPEQRGRQPTGNSVPWLELGEKTISYNLTSKIIKAFSEVRFPGLPTGGDIRFTNKETLVHLDIKLTGPNDNPNEVVVPPNQVSGRGDDWKNGIINSPWPVHYQGNGKINYNFQPKLPPFYLIDDKPLLCITMFLKAVYEVEKIGFQPLKYFELACVPNGLLMFDGPKLAETPGLIICGKDEKSRADDTKRIRIRLNPLASIENWRCTKIVRINGNKWEEKSR
ncbi:hypothetical protein C4578_00730 [Candidatus Microgenomates bacterium]|jgi:hypothetical protein|nr:MAG: hypothetical protein C4578_00730 [Candidatus Microgenomates bacterium]